MRYVVPAALAATLIGGISLTIAQATDVQQQATDKQHDHVALRNATSSTKELYDMIKKPTTPIELLENIKLVIDQNLLLREDFYTDENLEQLFGVTRIRWGENQQIHKYLDMKFDFKDSETSAWVSWQVLNSDGQLSTSGKIRASWIIELYGDSGIRFSNVEKIFGPGGKIKGAHETVPGSPGPGVPLTPPTDEMGNKVVTYEIINTPKTSKTRVSLIFDYRGIVERISFGEKEE